MLKVNLKKVNCENEVLIVDKPEDWTSHDVVAKIRGELSRRCEKRVKVGHGGTLDPLATGVLVVLVGKATKKFDEIRKQKKEYVVKVRLGKSMDTLDKMGKVVKKGKVAEFKRDELEKILRRFRGEIEQEIPAFSAKRVKGKRLYQLAREGKVFKLPKKKVKIFEIELLGVGDDWFKIRVECGSGAYMRQLGVDVAEKMGNLGYIEELRRTKVGKLTV